jgi:CRP-like cAMP-binding protein
MDEAKIPERGIRVKCKKCQNPIDINKSSPGNQPASPAKPDLAEEAIAKKFIRENNEQAVVQTLYDGIIRYAELKKFKESERLRAQLMKIAPMALTEIIRTGEIIDQEKTAAMDLEKVKLWTGLYDKFTKSEAASLYFALTDMTVKANTRVYEQGQFDDRLYFILSGKLKLSYFDTEVGRHLEYGFLDKGDIAGEDAFFTFTSHSSTLTAQTDVDLLYLGKTDFENILAENPHIETKLFDYCEKSKKTYRQIGKKGKARRSNKRYETTLTGQVFTGDSKDKLMKNVTKVTITDISTGGLCYVVQNMKKEEAATLHKNWISIITSYKKGPLMVDIKKLAKVIAVHFHPFGECSVHVQFKEPLDEKTIREISLHATAIR